MSASSLSSLPDDVQSLEIVSQNKLYQLCRVDSECTGVGVPVSDDVGVGLEHADVRPQLVGQRQQLRLARDVSRHLYT